MLGGYRILEKIGRGGMGAVYKANQVSLNRIVALKILSHRISADPAFVKRFQAEAQAAGRLNHPNIVQVYDVGFDQGVHFYSMEFIENGSVQDLATRVGTRRHRPRARRSSRTPRAGSSTPRSAASSTATSSPTT